MAFYFISNGSLFIKGSNKLVSAATRDALCPLKSYQLLETQLSQLECAMLLVTMSGRTRRPNTPCGECIASRRAGSASTVGGAINKP